MSTPGRTVQLSFSGQQAAILPDGFSPSGHVLEIGGAEQSHVDLAHPEEIFYEYLRRIGHVADAVAPSGAPITALHLGAGALTLPRYLQATRPGSRQVAVEIERELPGLVLQELPLPQGTDLQVLVGDARAALPEAAEHLGPVDLMVLDVFRGGDSPRHLAQGSFYTECLQRLSPHGALVVNVGDDPGLRFYAAQALALGEAARAAGGTGAWTLADAGVVEHAREGNLILAAGPGLDAPARGPEGMEELQDAWWAAGPHPAEVLDPLATEDCALALLG